jgi:hypothetical protein
MTCNDAASGIYMGRVKIACGGKRAQDIMKSYRILLRKSVERGWIVVGERERLQPSC